MSIPYVRDIRFEYGVVDQVSPLIRRVVARNPGPFTYTGTGTYIVGRREVAVLDPGPDLPEHLDALLAALEGERVAHVLVTHTHADHSPLAAPLAAATGATVYGRSAVKTEDGAPLEAGDDLAFRPDVPVEDGDLFRGPEWTLEAIATPGHASNHVCYALHEENALFTGDHVMGWSTTVVSPPDGDMGDYLQSLERVSARSFSRLWPTHGPPVEEPGPFLAAYRSHRLDRERQVLDQLASGVTRIRDMVPTLYAAVDRRLWPAAAHSLWAHMLWLVRSGRAASCGPPTLDAVYRLSPSA